MRRWIVPILAIGVLVTALVLLRSQPLDVQVRDIQSVALDAYPEGPPGPTFMRGERPDGELYLPFEQIEQFIPDPLPKTAWQGLACGIGGNLIVTLHDGDTITYGPCRRPESIDRLWAHMVDIYSQGECRPGCGPGDYRIE